MRTISGLLGLPVALSSCGEVVSSDPDPSGVSISTTASVYRWGDVANGTGMTIEATLTNNGTREYYARLGDGFNSAEEQSQLYVATGSDAYLERSDSSDWIAVDRATLIEGVGPVVLRPGASYSLVAFVTGPRITGLFRLRVEHYGDTDFVGQGRESVSNVFELR